MICDAEIHTDIKGAIFGTTIDVVIDEFFYECGAVCTLICLRAKEMLAEYWAAAMKAMMPATA